MANEFVGELSYLSLCTESTWGVLPGSPSWVQVPVLSYGVRMGAEMRQSPTFTGVLEEKHNQVFRGMPSGSIQMPLYGWHPANASMSQMQWMLAWIHNNALNTIARPSKSCFWAEGPNIANKIHTGLRCGSFTIAGSAGSPVTLTVDLMGYDELGMDSAGNEADTAPTLVTDREKLLEVLFEDCSLTLGGTGTGMKAFSVRTNFNYSVEYNNSHRPSLILAKKTTTDVAFTILKNSDTWDAYNRGTTNTETTAALVLKGLHNGTGATGDWTLATLPFNRLSLVTPPTEGGQDIQYQNLQFKALKPDSSSASYSYAMSEA